MSPYDNIPRAEVGQWRNMQISGSGSLDSLWKDFSARMTDLLVVIERDAPSYTPEERAKVAGILAQLAQELGFTREDKTDE